ncbi:MAG: hypothetical protein ABF746_11885 [Acetobacter orientalis]|uniref:hypothetical protein n=1 Tax=Acetobacter orientalis TaxID=146474 RepID=UPI00241C2B58|nr:hypothetical protein [Acetobacter orientalis]
MPSLPKLVAPPARRPRTRKTAAPITPLAIFTRIMQGDETITDRQFDAAKVAAPYMHPKLSGLPLAASPRKALEDYSDEELAALAQAGQPDSTE